MEITGTIKGNSLAFQKPTGASRATACRCLKMEDAQ